MKKLIGALVSAGAMLLTTAAPAGAAGGYTLFGDATLTTGHNSPTGVQLRSSPTVAPGYGGIAFSLPAGTTFADVQTLATDFMVTQGDCGGGAPRFTIDFSVGGTASAYIGPAPNYTHCPAGWNATGNLLSGSNKIDTSQLGGGTFYDSLTHAYSTYGSMTITEIDLIVDADWFVNGPQTVVVDNVNINGTIFTFESAASCKDGGWQNFASAPGPFKSQGDCVSSFATGGTNS